MNKQFAKKWLNELKEYWFNKDIERAVLKFIWKNNNNNNKT